MLCRPSTAYGADGPWGTNVDSQGNVILGYSGPNATIAQCPTGQVIVGMRVGASSLGGFTYFEVGPDHVLACLPLCQSELFVGIT